MSARKFNRSSRNEGLDQGENPHLDLISDEESGSALPTRVDTDELDFGTEHHDGEEVWLISYADLMTLLVAFFALLLSFSKMDPEAMENIKKETTKAFGGEYIEPFEDLSKSLNKVIQDKNLNDMVRIEQKATGIIVTFQGALFFNSGRVDLKESALGLMENVIPIINSKAKNFRVIIEGHTDDIPIDTGLVKSNWELSGLRASTVARLFIEKGSPKKMIKVEGLADTRPIFPNRDERNIAIPENQAQNRRVVIRILRPEEI